MRPHLILTLFAMLLAGPLLRGQGALLDAYVLEAIEQSPYLKEQNLILEKSQVALAEAKGFYLPEVNLGGTYSLAAGGRSISIPIGDLLNPVYSTLNQLTQTNNFPQVENAEEQFLPNNFYDLRLRTTMPLYNPDVRLQQKARAEQVNLEESTLALRKRDLVRDVQTAYFQYLLASEAINIYDNALALLQESHRLNEGLVRNGMAIPSSLLRIQGEISSVEARKFQAESQQTLAQANFNNLLGRPYDSAVDADPAFEALPGVSATRGQREELDQLETAARLNALAIEREEKWRYPRVGLQLDLGSQDFNFAWDGYAILGLSVNVPLWDGARHSKRLQQAELGALAVEAQREWAVRQIDLQVIQATQSLQSAIAIGNSYDSQLQSAERFYGETLKRFRENQANYIELLDARTQWTNLELEASIARYQAWIYWAQFQRATANNL